VASPSKARRPRCFRVWLIRWKLARLRR
jgi:hypothetical protein